MAAELEYESVLCVKPDVSVYRIPPRASNRGYRASDWKLDQPDWTGRLRITSKGKIAYIKLEDKVSGELFAQAPVEQYPGIAVETVTDSSRYFVIRIQDGTGRSAFIGIGFTDRGDAFDFNVSLQDHFKWVKQESEISKECQEMDTRPKLDLGFKEGQTITLSIGNITTKKGGASKPKTAGAGGLSLLPPPPGGKVTIPPPSSSVAISNHVTPPPIPKSNHGGSDAGYPDSISRRLRDPCCYTSEGGWTSPWEEVEIGENSLTPTPGRPSTCKRLSSSRLPNSIATHQGRECALTGGATVETGEYSPT
uniref:Adaptin ear-binding coat-associated protein 1 n=1 Tax=Equus caballus TaxID=9796 RepID=A0A9L0T8Y9_HORSE